MSDNHAGAAWRREAGDLTRGFAGGVLFAVPLLYTVEVWSLGGAATPPRLLGVLALTVFPVGLLIHSAGFRRQREVRVVDSVIDAVEALALGVVAGGVVLVLLGEIRPDTPMREVVGKLVYEAAPFAIGVAVACHVFARSRDDDEQESLSGDDYRSRNRSSRAATVADIGATTVGALFVALNVAPTDEIPLLAASASAPSLLGIVAFSLVASYAIVFEAGFGDQQRRHEQEGLLQHPVTETAAAYLLALVSAAAMLFFFENLSGLGSWRTMLSEVVLLGLPAAIGGAAGRLAA